MDTDRQVKSPFGEWECLRIVRQESLDKEEVVSIIRPPTLDGLRMAQDIGMRQDSLYRRAAT